MGSHRRASHSYRLARRVSTPGSAGARRGAGSATDPVFWRRHHHRGRRRPPSRICGRAGTFVDRHLPGASLGPFRALARYGSVPGGAPVASRPQQMAWRLTSLKLTNAGILTTPSRIHPGTRCRRHLLVCPSCCLARVPRSTSADQLWRSSLTGPCSCSKGERSGRHRTGAMSRVRPEVALRPEATTRSAGREVSPISAWGPVEAIAAHRRSEPDRKAVPAVDGDDGQGERHDLLGAELGR